MRLVPEDNVGRIYFYRTRVEKWVEGAAELGIAVENAEALRAETEAAWAAYQAALLARQAAETATARMNNAIERMATSGSALVSQIRGHAQFTGDAAVYERALIAAPAKASPVAEPGKPEEFKVELTSLGSVTLTWKCKHPRGAVGTVYKVSRRLGTEGPFEFLGVVGEKRFEDYTIPPGTATLTYHVQAVRSRKAGPVGQHNVSFGTGDTIPREMFAPVRAVA